MDQHFTLLKIFEGECKFANPVFMRFLNLETFTNLVGGVVGV